MIESIHAINVGLRTKFPGGNQPFQIMTRLLEECGELAQQVNHFEGSGTKGRKMGEPSKAALADEIKGVLLNAFQVADYYDVLPDLEKAIAAMQSRLERDGFLS